MARRMRTAEASTHAGPRHSAKAHAMQVARRVARSRVSRSDRCKSLIRLRFPNQPHQYDTVRRRDECRQCLSSALSCPPLMPGPCSIAQCAFVLAGRPRRAGKCRQFFGRNPYALLCICTRHPEASAFRCEHKPGECRDRSRDSELLRNPLESEPLMNTTKSLLVAALLSGFGAAAFAQAPGPGAPEGPRQMQHHEHQHKQHGQNHHRHHRHHHAHGAHDSDVR